MKSVVPEDRFCRRCGRRIEWRRKWAADWERIAYCGEKCRRHKLGRRDREIERALMVRAGRSAADANFVEKRFFSRRSAPADARPAPDLPAGGVRAPNSAK